MEKIRLYEPSKDGIYLQIPDNMMVSNVIEFYRASEVDALLKNFEQVNADLRK